MRYYSLRSFNRGRTGAETSWRSTRMALLFGLAASFDFAAGAQATTMSVTATKTKDASGTSVTEAMFSIAQAQKIFWTATYTGGPTDGNDFYLYTDPTNLIQYPLTTNGAPSGNMMLQPGTYHISIRFLGMGPGIYTVKYDPTGNGANNGDPHLTTVNGVHYDFQGAGEYVALRGKDIEIQTRQTPVPTAASQPDPHTGLTSSVSINTAVAVRMGANRVSLQFDKGNLTAESRLTLRLNGVVAAIPAGGLKPASNDRIQLSEDGIYRFDFADGTMLSVTPGWWEPLRRWYLNLDVLNTPANEGLMGIVADRNWLPDMPDGRHMGIRPAPIGRRYHDLYARFGRAWRVTAATSLFDYGAGESPATFVMPGWPRLRPPFSLPGQITPKGLGAMEAARACAAVRDQELNRECRFDVAVMGDRGIAKSYRKQQRVRPERGAAR